MKKYFVIIIGLIISFNNLNGQEAKEVKQPIGNSEYETFINSIQEIQDETPDKAIKLLDDGLAQYKASSEQYGIISILVRLYTEKGLFDESMKLWEKGHKQGLFFAMMMTPRTWPEYLEKYKSFKRYDKILKKNDELKDKAQKTTIAEYFVKLPKDYSANKTYPLLMVFHGGIGSHKQSSEAWQSEKLEQEYIVAYIQGGRVFSSYLRAHGPDGQKDYVQAYRQISQDYPIDTTKIILGGPSAGGHMSVKLAMENKIPAAGLLLAFPVKPQDLKASDVLDAALRGLRVAMLCGENDQWYLKGEKEMAVIFDKMGVANRFVVFPGIGHEYSDDFSKQIDISIDYLWDK